jgi:hypothetical protein
MLLTQGAFAEFGIFKMSIIKTIFYSFCMHLYHFYPNLLTFTTVRDKICVDLLSYTSELEDFLKKSQYIKQQTYIQAIV